MTKSLLLLLTLLAVFSFENKLSAQTIHVDEDFNTGSLPTGWTNSALSELTDGSLGTTAQVHILEITV